ncbi:BACON domain-containing protein [Bacteroides sp. ET225]|uniref:BACON domain-containing protein n=1 Tax=Bacteroides sp. ET225 TaxID=2972461 RepID=UPI0021ACD30A|nr:BACON domain-containing protein [Bacteroides sp. ET225]MCR8916711.1 BACON domain-containing protein [Bacteroides sp. ET225]
MIMKKILYFLMPFLCMGLVGCNDDDSPVGESILNIKSADLDFTAVGGEGSIIVDGYGTISAASDKDWCTVSVDGMTIHVTVAESQEITSRTALITISTGTDSREVPVVQSGALATLGNEPTLHVFGYDGGTFEYSFKSNVGYTVEIPEDAKSWISYVEDTEEEADGWTRLVFTASVNATGTLRGAKILFSTGGKETSFVVLEMEEADLLGTWDCSYTSPADGEHSGKVEIVKSQDGLMMMSELSMGTFIPVAFSNGQFAVLGGQLIGTYGMYYVITGTVQNGDLIFGGQCVADFSVDDGRVVIKVGDSFSYFGLWAINPSTMQSAGYLEQYIDFILSKQMQ